MQQRANCSHFLLTFGDDFSFYRVMVLAFVFAITSLESACFNNNLYTQELHSFDPELF